MLTPPLINIPAMALGAPVGGADGSVALADWARRHEGWLERSLDLGAVIPSHDRRSMVSRRLDTPSSNAA